MLTLEIKELIGFFFVWAICLHYIWRIDFVQFNKVSHEVCNHREKNDELVLPTYQNFKKKYFCITRSIS
jgi:hypothetical protein